MGVAQDVKGHVGLHAGTLAGFPEGPRRLSRFPGPPVIPLKHSLISRLPSNRLTEQDLTLCC